MKKIADIKINSPRGDIHEKLEIKIEIRDKLFRYYYPDGKEHKGYYKLMDKNQIVEYGNFYIPCKEDRDIKKQAWVGFSDNTQSFDYYF